MSRKATGELKNVQAGACQVFLRGVSFRHQGGRDRRQSASAASESVLGPEIPVFYGGCLFHDRILGPATGPSDRSRALAVSAKPQGQRDATPSAHNKRITRTREETTSRSKRSASIRSMRRRVWPIADANRALKAAIRGSVAKAATATLRYGLLRPGTA